LTSIAILCPPGSAAAVEVSIQRLADASVVARYVFDDEITEFRFRVEDRALRDQWQVAEESLTLTNDAVSSITGSPFRTATLTLRPTGKSAATAPRTSPTLMSMGPTSTLVNLTHLFVRGTDDLRFVMHDAFDESAGACVAQRTIRIPPDEVAGAILHHAFVSTARDACESAVGNAEGAIFSANVSAALRQLITRDFSERYENLLRRLHLPAMKMTVFVVHGGDGGLIRVLRGAGDVLVALIEGDSWSAPTQISSERLLSSMLGSVLIGWLRGPENASSATARPAANWLVAAATPYIDIVTGIEHGRATDPSVRANVDLADLCVRMRTPGLLGPAEGPPIDRMPRQCGVLVYLVYDAMTRAESAGGRTIYDLWAAALAARNGTEAVDAAAFLATNPRAEAALAGLLHGPEVDFKPIVAALQRAGVDAELTETPDSGGATMSLLRPFLDKTCPGVRFGIGFAGQDVGMGVDLHGPCDRLPQKFSFIAIEGRGIRSPAHDIYDAVGRACATDGRIRLTTTAAAAPELGLECPDQIPSVPLGLKIRDLGILLH
jgi:hypothetical protein